MVALNDLVSGYGHAALLSMRVDTVFGMFWIV